MKIRGIGIDVADISRYLFAREDYSLAERILHPNEMKRYCLFNNPDSRAAFLASRFAAKEAYVKASNDRNVDYRTIEVQKDSTGAPHLHVGGKEIEGMISISHDKVAVAVVILYE